MLRLLNFENHLVPSVNKMRTQEYAVAREPAFDIFETAESYVLEADVPGLDKDELDINPALRSIFSIFSWQAYSKKLITIQFNTVIHKLFLQH